MYSCDFPDWFGALRSLVYLFRIVIGLNFLLTARSVIESRQGQLSVFHTCYAIYPSSYSVDAMVFFFFRGTGASSSSFAFVGNLSFSTAPFQLNELWDLRYSAMLTCRRLLVIDVSEQRIDLFLESEGVQEMGRIGFPETWVTHCQSTLRNIPEEQTSCLLCGGSLKSWNFCFMQWMGVS